MVHPSEEEAVHPQVVDDERETAVPVGGDCLQRLADVALLGEQMNMRHGKRLPFGAEDPAGEVGAGACLHWHE
ncbi:MAG: hypothetical protein QHJ34_10720 [bacterium]|jgi:hypothetical protein|nr:hypothetical protein [candidate division KSB1 bacterium]MDH7560686.1 hypothetical protein [bacterium]